MGILGNVVGSLAGPLGSALGGAVGDLFGLNQQVAAQKRDMKFQKWMAANKYQLMSGDLERAGLNPILAVSGGMGSPGAGGSHSPGMVGAHNPISAGISSAADVKRIDKIDAEVSEISQKIRESMARIKNIDKDTQYKESQIDVNVQEVFYKVAKSAEGWAAAQYYYASASERDKQSQYLDKQIAKLAFELPRLGARAKVYEGIVGDVLAYAYEIQDSFGIRLDSLASLVAIMKGLKVFGKSGSKLDPTDFIK